jgi:hypothetical protein
MTQLYIFTLFFKQVLFKSCEENNSNLNIQYYLLFRRIRRNAEWIYLFTESTRNQSVCIPRKHGINLYIYREYAEWGKSLNRFCCTYLLNTQNESVHILRKCGINLLVHWEYADRICKYIENAWNAQKSNISANLKPNRKSFLTFIRTLEESGWPNHWK